MKTTFCFCSSIVALLVLSCNEKKDQLSQAISLEQKALTVFLDSVAYKPIDDQSDNDSSELVPILPGVPIDSVWEYKGMFLGYNLTIDGYASQLSKPYVDTLSFISNQEFYNDSAKQEIIGYWKYQRDYLLADTTRVELQIPDSLKKDILKNFLSRKANRDIFLQVYKKISSRTTQMVRITAFMRTEKYLDYVTFDFCFFQHKKSGNCFWYFE